MFPSDQYSNEIGNDAIIVCILEQKGIEYVDGRASHFTSGKAMCVKMQRIFDTLLYHTVGCKFILNAELLKQTLREQETKVTMFY